MEDHHQNNNNNNNNDIDDADAENPDLARLDELEWYSAFHFASEVIGGKCSIDLLRVCREYEAISLVEEVFSTR